MRATLAFNGLIDNECNLNDFGPPKYKKGGNLKGGERLSAKFYGKKKIFHVSQVGETYFCIVVCLAPLAYIFHVQLLSLCLITWRIL